MGPRATAILEQSFQRGIAKGGDRRSCFQMEEKLSNRLPVEESVSVYVIQPWLSNRLKKEKENNDPAIVRAKTVKAERTRFTSTHELRSLTIFRTIHNIV